jgi:folate-binding protein YgfZ
MQCTSAGGVSVIGLPTVQIDGAETRRWIVVVPAVDLDRIAAGLVAKLAPVGSAQWRWTEVLAGIARIVPATSELFVPQMVNYELVGGVSFTKGCYPGQEVVARSHYLGKLKRRMFLGHVAGEPPAPASDVADASGSEPCGQVVMAAPAPGGGTDLLFECRTEAAQKGGLQVAGAPLALASLPYPFPA